MAVSDEGFSKVPEITLTKAPCIDSFSSLDPLSKMTPNNL